MTPLEALQATLSAEHAAVYVLATLGGRVAASADPTAAILLGSAYETHRARRDQLRSRIAARDATPVAAAAAYDVPARDRRSAHLLEVAWAAESRCAEAYAQQVGATSGEERRWAVDALVDSAGRVLTLGGEPSAYPGLRELS